MEKYYGIAGVNAYGVYNSYEKVMKAKEYIAKFKIKSFKEVELAKNWAERQFYDLQEDYLFEYEIGQIQKMNWTYYRKKVA